LCASFVFCFERSENLVWLTAASAKEFPPLVLLLFKYLSLLLLLLLLLLPLPLFSPSFPV